MEFALRRDPVAEAPGELRPEAIGARPNVVELVNETIVFEERPVLFVTNDWVDTENVTRKGPEADELIGDLTASRAKLEPVMPLVGRIDVVGFPNIDYVGTGWLVDTDIVVTNRHVASLIARWDGRKFAFSRGVAGRPYTASLSTEHEFDDLTADPARGFAVAEVLYIEPDEGPNDIAFLRVVRRTDGTKRDRINVAKTDLADNMPVVVVGYPARASRNVIPNQELMKELYLGRYDVKRATPGYTMSTREGVGRHDCTTLGGNSGSVVLDLASGEAVGLHFAGLYQETNYAVRASVLAEYINKKRWMQPPNIEASGSPPKPPRPGTPPPAPTVAASSGCSGSVTFTIPLNVTVSLGSSVTGIAAGAAAFGDPAPTASGAEAATMAFWDERPDGVIAVRTGFSDDGETIGDTPFIAASVPAARLPTVEAGAPRQFRGYEVRYFPADAAEQISAWPGLESVDSIAYDDNARTGQAFSFDTVEQQMSVRVHVGPEYSWDELNSFLAGAEAELVSAIYEFHAPQIKDVIEARLEAGVQLTLVMDNATFSKVKDEEEEFDRVETFTAWKDKFQDLFESVVAPEGLSGLISDSYHIKVTVREDDTFWLSSGNWKKGSSQPVITQDERDHATETDLPGNREWHVVIKNKTLAERFRRHILQDFKRSTELGGGPFPKQREAPEIFVDVPTEEAVVLERRAPNRILKPRQFDRRTKVKPLLTPDKDGAVYSRAVLELIHSARHSLLFQIPYIGMPSNPREDRGYIDDLIKALTEKLKTLDDARVILRVGGSRFSDPTHAAWYFKSKGVEIAERVRRIENHHTKGMIVDGKRILIGSHNWSKPGVTLNRDASLIFDDEDIASYFAEAFEIDWERSNPIRPKRYVKGEAVVQEATGAAPPAGFERVRLSDLLKDED